MQVGGGLKSCTTELGFAGVERPEGRPFLEDCRLTLVDTPGFDGTEESDFAVLEKIARWLKDS